MASLTSLLALDVGEKRIGVAIADPSVRIAVSYNTLAVDGSEHVALKQIVAQERVSVIVVGYPRNQAGEMTAQTRYVEQFADTLRDLGPEIVFQDESVTSIQAEKLLVAQKKPYTKADIDALAASIILQDYLERHGRV
jgi:putative Holliday junction resolvase